MYLSRYKGNSILKIFILTILIVSLIFALGCNIWPFAKKDTAKEALTLKNKADQIFVTVQSHSKDFDILLKKLNKHWYTTKDAKEFASSLSTAQGQIKQDQASIKELEEKLQMLTEIDKEGKFTKYVDVTKKASYSLSQALSNSLNIVNALSPKYTALAKLFTNIDEVKQAQSRYIVANSAAGTRQVQATLSKMLADRALVSSQTESTTTDTTADTTTDTTTSTDQSTTTSTDQSTTTQEQTNNDTGSNTATESSSSTSTSSSSSDLNQWVYIISQNKWPSSYINDFAREASDNFNKLYIDAYEIHREVKFNNSGRLKDYLQQVKEDVAGFASSIEAITDNLKEQRRLVQLRDRANQILASSKAVHENLTAAETGRPAAVPGNSVSSKGISWAHRYTHTEIERYEDKIRSYNSSLDSLNKNYEGALNSEYKESAWRFSGSLYALYKVNIGINRNVIHEIKRWKNRAVTKYVFLRLEHLAEAKQQSYRSNKAYIEAKSKIASK